MHSQSLESSEGREAALVGGEHCRVLTRLSVPKVQGLSLLAVPSGCARACSVSHVSLGFPFGRAKRWERQAQGEGYLLGRIISSFNPSVQSDFLPWFHSPPLGKFNPSQTVRHTPGIRSSRLRELRIDRDNPTAFVRFHVRSPSEFQTHWPCS